MELLTPRDFPLGRLIDLAARLMSQRWSRYLAEHHGLTPAGMSVLFTLAQGGHMTHRRMAEVCYVRPATLTGIVDTLERSGLVERRRDAADRRAVHLALTSEGERHARELLGVISTDRPLTSVDADPAKAAVIREFLLELIQATSEGEDPTVIEAHLRGGRTPGGEPC
ncbi:MarR family winged helix-turn-helix transcriptional regulator [Plantactinospora sp. GCM10030261]|uniref:MarR family winged helix-turn-helix transcriptional regulator n=1 Tax=Plantactinospora sp. GCM10030261 TaxID=3273420 RepID=UPI003611E1D1